MNIFVMPRAPFKITLHLIACFSMRKQHQDCIQNPRNWPENYACYVTPVKPCYPRLILSVFIIRHIQPHQQNNHKGEERYWQHWQKLFPKSIGFIALAKAFADELCIPMYDFHCLLGLLVNTGRLTDTRDYNENQNQQIAGNSNAYYPRIHTKILPGTSSF